MGMFYLMPAKINEKVIYNGKIEYANSVTKDLLQTIFKIGRSYVVRLVLERKGKYYYKFKGLYCNYPVECFDTKHQDLKNRYDLK